MKPAERYPILPVLAVILISLAQIACTRAGAPKQSAAPPTPVKLPAAQEAGPSPADQLALNLKELDQVWDYYGQGRHHYSGEGAMVIRLPLDNALEYGVAERLVDSRRVWVVLQDLSKLPKQRAAELVSREILAALPVYQKMFDEEIAKLIRIRAAQNIEREPGKPISGISFQISNKKDGSPTIVGLRMKLLALCLVAGNLELRQARPAMIELTHAATAQRELIYGEKKLKWDFDRFGVAKDFTLYNRVILATGLAGTAPGGLKSGSTAWDWVSFRCPLDDAGAPTSYETAEIGPATAFETPVANNRHSMNIWIHRGLTDKELDSLLPSPSNGDSLEPAPNR